MFNRSNGRKGETLDATFSYPETQKDNVSRIDSSSSRTAMITDQVEIKGTLAFDGALEADVSFGALMFTFALSLERSVRAFS